MRLRLGHATGAATFGYSDTHGDPDGNGVPRAAAHGNRAADFDHAAHGDDAPPAAEGSHHLH
ncbi:MAG: hypothetical protein HZB20_07500 [Chloroflexi bacterium]|nr:hypothetical protein [Chloroflexota bacterium]